MLEIESYENRGTEEVPFGFVYFNDDSRVGYSDTNGVFQPRTNGGGKFVEVTTRHLQMARTYLRQQGIKV